MVRFHRGSLLSPKFLRKFRDLAGPHAASVVCGAPVYFLFFVLCCILVAVLQGWNRSWLICALACGALGIAPFAMLVNHRLPVADLVQVLPLALAIAGLPGALFGGGLSLLWPTLSTRRGDDVLQNGSSESQLHHKLLPQTSAGPNERD